MLDRYVLVNCFVIVHVVEQHTVYDIYKIKHKKINLKGGKKHNIELEQI